MHMYTHICTCVCEHVCSRKSVFYQARRGCQIPQNWTVNHPEWALGTEPYYSSERTSSDLNHWATPPTLSDHRHWAPRSEKCLTFCQSVPLQSKHRSETYLVTEYKQACFVASVSHSHGAEAPVVLRLLRGEQHGREQRGREERLSLRTLDLDLKLLYERNYEIVLTLWRLILWTSVILLAKQFIGTVFV